MPRGNVDLFGRELTVSLDALERAIERERPDLFATLAVDGTVTIVFTDIVDSTVLTSRLGDQRLGVMSSDATTRSSET